MQKKCRLRSILKMLQQGYSQPYDAMIERYELNIIKSKKLVHFTLEVLVEDAITYLILVLSATHYS